MAAQLSRVGRWYAWRIRYSAAARVYEFDGGNLPDEVIRLPVARPAFVSPHTLPAGRTWPPAGPWTEQVELRSTRRYSGALNADDAWQVSVAAADSGSPALKTLVDWLDRAGFSPDEWLDILPVEDRPSFELEATHNPLWQEWNVLP